MPEKTLFAETKAASEGEAGTEVPVLCAVRPDLSAGHTGRGMEAGARQSGRPRRGRRLDPPGRNAGSGRSWLSGRNPGSVARQNLQAESSAPCLHTEGQRKDETAGDSDGAGPGGADGDRVNPGAD